MPGKCQRTTADEERDVAPQAGAELQQFVLWHRIPCQPVGCLQGGGCIARSTAKTGADRDLFAQPEMDCKAVSRGFQNAPRSSHREVVLHRANLGADDIDGYPAAFPPFRCQRVGQAHQAEHSLQGVKPVITSGQNPKQEIDLGMTRDRDNLIQ